MKGSMRSALEGGVSLGLSLRLSRTTDIARILKDAGFGWMFLDLEHGTMSFDTLTQMALAGIEAGIAPMVRVPDFDPATIGRVLSNGAMGIIAPHVSDPGEARRIARACRFAPLGERSVPGTLPHLGYAPRTFAEASEILNRETFVTVMIESGEAVANADSIAAVEGVDCLFIGASDLTFALGIPSRYDHPDVAAAVDAVAAAAARHGKVAGIGGVSDPALLRTYIDRGMRMVLAGNDLGLLLDGMRRRVASLAKVC